MSDALTARSAREYREERDRLERAKRGLRLAVPETPPPPNEYVGPESPAAGEDGPQQPFAPFAGEAPEWGPKGIVANKFKLVPWGESTFDPNEEWRIKHIMPMKGVGLIYGKSQSLKSFVAMHLALSVALGEAWADKRVKKAAVVYLCAEGQGGFPKRVAGLTKARGIKGDVDVHIVYTVPNLGTMEGDLLSLIASIEGAGIKPGLIVVDTTAKTIGSAEENGAGMAAFVWNAGALSEHLGCFVLAVHHVGHGEDAQKRPRGWSGVIGAGDTLILCERDGEEFSTTLTIQKEKDEASGFSLTAHLSRVVLGTDRDGDEISTLVVDEVVKAEALAKSVIKTPVATQRRLLIDVVREAIDEAGEEFRARGDSPPVRAVDDEHIRTRLYAAIAEQVGPDEDPDKLERRQNQAFNRSIAGALNAKIIIAKARGRRRMIWLP
jgi:hypothetical protein